MPKSKPETTTVLDLIRRQYAKVVAKRAFKSQGGQEAGFYDHKKMKIKFQEIDSGSKLWEEINSQDQWTVKPDKQCSYCGATEGLHLERLIPESIQIKPECRTCDRMQAANNQVWACSLCNFRKGSRGLYEFYRALYSKKTDYDDRLPTALEKKYLKTIYHCHQCAGTLDAEDLDGDGELTVLDIDFILSRSKETLSRKRRTP